MNDYVWVVFVVVLVVAGLLLMRRPPEKPAVARERETRDPRESQAPTLIDDVRPIAKLSYEEDDDEITLLGPVRKGEVARKVVGATPSAVIVDEDAAGDEPTGPVPLILIHAAGQTDRGKTRKRNEDSYLVLPEGNVYAVADGMGGYVGGDVASQLAIATVEHAFESGEFPGQPFEELPSRASELLQAIEAANAAIVAEANRDPSFRGMGTTIVAARFSPRKLRLYIGHVGDSRAYRLRGGNLVQMTVDHTMAAAGSKGPQADRLMRALGVSKSVDVDVLVAKPKPGDFYLFCTDGLSKMLTAAEIRDILKDAEDPTAAVKAFVERANEAGGKDNVTAIVVRVAPFSRR